jgi:hypothetical protein
MSQVVIPVEPHNGDGVQTARDRDSGDYTTTTDTATDDMGTGATQ